MFSCRAHGRDSAHTVESRGADHARTRKLYLSDRAVLLLTLSPPRSSMNGRRPPAHRSRERAAQAAERGIGGAVVDAASTPSGRSVFSDDMWRQITDVLRLSRRESEILKAVFDDQQESSIAAHLGISTHTVHTHLERVYRKLSVSSRVGLVVRVVGVCLSSPTRGQGVP